MMAQKPALIVPEWGPCEIAALETAIRSAPVWVRERYAGYFTATRLRADRLALRDGWLLRMAVGRNGDAESLATSVHADLSRYASASWRYERDADVPRDPRHNLSHGVLRLNRGRTPSIRSLRRLFALVAKTPDEMATLANQDQLK